MLHIFAAFNDTFPPQIPSRVKVICGVEGFQVCCVESERFHWCRAIGGSEALLREDTCHGDSKWTPFGSCHTITTPGSKYRYLGAPCTASTCD